MARSKSEQDILEEYIVKFLFPDASAEKWRLPFTKDRPNIFYFSFSGSLIDVESLKGLIKFDDNTISILRNTIQKIQSYANVKLIEVDSLDGLPAKARKFSIMGADDSLIPPILTFEEFSKNGFGLNRHVGVTYSFGALSEKSKSPSNNFVDAKLLIMPRDILTSSSKEYTESIFTHELLHVFGFKHPCEEMLKKSSERFSEKKSAAFLLNCKGLVSPHSVMEVPSINPIKCMEEHKEHGEKEAFAICSGFKDVGDPVKPADRAALEGLLGGPVKKKSKVSLPVVTSEETKTPVKLDVKDIVPVKPEIESDRSAEPEAQISATVTPEPESHILYEMGKALGTGFAVSFMDTLLRFYAIPYFMNCGVSRYKAVAAGEVASVAIKTIGTTIPMAVAGTVFQKALSSACSAAGFSDDRSKSISGIVATGISVATDPFNLLNIPAGMTGAAAGHFAAREVIRRLPKLKDEPEVVALPQTDESRVISSRRENHSGATRRR